jgi:hypothetical protein
MQSKRAKRGAGRNECSLRARISIKSFGVSNFLV